MIPDANRNGKGVVTPELKDDEIDAKFSINLSEKLRRSSFSKAVRAPPAPVRASESTGLSKEHMEQGSVKRRVYSEYVKAASKTGFLLYLLAIVLQQAASVLSNLVLRSWGEHNSQMGDNSNMWRYMLVYGLSSLSSILFSGMAAILIWVLCSIRSAKQLHDSVGIYLFIRKLILRPHRCCNL